jgi:excisionase family DNA binding protein
MEQFEDKTQDVKNNRLLTLEETAEMLDVPVNTIRRWAYTGTLPALSSGRSFEKRFKMTDIMEFILK